MVGYILCMLTPEMLWFGSSGATSLARGPAQTSSIWWGSEAFLTCQPCLILDSADLHGIAVVVVYQSIDASLIIETTSKGVKRSVLLNQDHNILDLALP